MHRSPREIGFVSFAAAALAAVLAAGCTWEILDIYPEDSWEDNDGLAGADLNADLSAFEGARLTELDPYGAYANVTYMDDADYFKITAPAGAARLLVYCEFEHFWGDVDLELLDEAGVPLAEAVSQDDDESVDYDFVAELGSALAADTVFYVRVTLYSGTQNVYDLWWSTVTEVDAREPNDDDLNATVAAEEAWLSESGNPWPHADEADEDWYLVPLGSGQDTIEAWCDFYGAFGDLEMELRRFDGAEWVVEAASTGPGDGEHILATGLSPDDYFVVVFGAPGSAANVYDLYFDMRP